MGACASRPLHCKREPLPGEDAGVGLNIPISRRQMVTSSVDNDKRSTADLIISAFIAQAEAEPEPTKGITARLASRRGPEDRHASSQATHLGIGPAPAAESRAELASGGPPTASINRAKETHPCSAPIPVCPPEDSFELSRVETVKRLVIMQKSFKSGSSVPSPAWAFSEGPDPRDAGDTSARRAGGPDDELSSDQPGARSSGRMGSGSGSDEDVGGEPVKSGSEEAGEDVLQMDGELGDGLDFQAAEKAPAAAAGAAATKTRREAEKEMGLEDAAAPGGGYEGSCKGEACSTPRRDEEPGAFRTIFISRMQGNAKAAGGDGGGAAAGAAGDAAGAPPATTTDIRSETDELTSLPLPNLVCPRAGASNAARLQSRAGHRYSASSYLQQAAMEPLVSLSDGLAASRNSDLGYYLEEARLAPAASSPLRGAQPVRHNLMHSDMVRQRAAQAAKEAEGAARPAPVVLDYVPSIRSQASRGSLLAQPSQKRLLCGGGGGISLMGDDDNGSAAAARRLEYVPKKSISCRSSHANQYSGSTLLGASSSSRPLSPTNSRPSASQPGHQISDCLPGSPRTAGADSGERCFHVTRAGTAIATASAAAAGGGSNSGSLLPSSASGGLPMGAARRRGAVERRDSSSCSQVHFGPTAVLQAPATPSLPAQRSTPSHEMSRRAQRGIVPVPALDTRPGAWTTTTTTSSPSSRLHMQLSGGDAAAAGRRAVLHEVLGSAAWTGAGTAPSSPLAAAALSASGIAGRGASCSGAVRIDGGEAATAAAGSYGPGSASRAAGRAARLLESLQRLNVTVPEVKLVQ